MLQPRAWYLAVQTLDLRCEVDRLLLFVKNRLGGDGFDGAAYVFRNRSGLRLKLLCLDATGVWLCVRRLHRGSFVRPRSDAGLMAVSAAQMAWSATGVDWQRMSADLSSVPRLL